MKSFLFILLLFCYSSASVFGKRTKQYHSQYIEIIIDNESNIYCLDFSFYKEKNDHFLASFKLEGFYSEGAKFELPRIAAEYLSESYWLESFRETPDTLHYSADYEKCSNLWLKVTDVNLDGKSDICVLDINASGKGGSYFAILIQLPNKLVYWKGAPNPYQYSNPKTNSIYTSWRAGGSYKATGKFKIKGDTVVQPVRFWSYMDENPKTGKLIMRDSIFINSTWKVEIDSNFLWEQDGGEAGINEKYLD